MQHQPSRSELLRLPPPSGGPIAKTLYSLLTPPLSKFIGLSEINRIYAHSAVGDTDRFLDMALGTMGIDIALSDEDRARIPAEGPCVVVANHPFGAVEGMILAKVLRQARPDAKLMANYLLALIPEMARIIIQVDPFGTGDSTKKNIGPLKEAMRFLRDGGILGIFPAGEVSSINILKRAITDKEWSPTVGRIIKRTGVPVLPVYFKGSNRALFHLMGLIHPRLRTIMLPREMLKRQNTTIEMRIGQPIPPSQLKGFETDEQLMEYLKLRTYVLRNRDQKEKPRLALPPKASVEIVAPQSREALEAEIAALPREQILVESVDQIVFIARKPQIPNCMEEIGRLREITFREVGEGTGKATDLDRFDDAYWHLAMWSRTDREIMGAYRLGPVDEILRDKGPSGLYTNTLFTLKPRFLESINPGLEMGRSFIQSRYQKSYTSLLMLWKGIGVFVSRNPRYAMLFGPVSISNDYKGFSRELMLRFLSMREAAGLLSKTVKPKTPPKLKPLSLSGLVINSARQVCRDIDDLAALISEVEGDQKGVPVLLRQYLKLGGKLLAFNVDQDFADALDGLILVDLRLTDPKILARYMGKDGAKEFLAHHGIEAEL
ncbi:phospholipid/glycerol acyltransferase [Alkalidesulfovibrio alkalitolerans DSM 16529]|uniref:Phospholipid/glycerol acyltransferase n=1 Tax=Alkalidesulfovibrio alkalitolerans DSM 16529 TaxID=1121439 RepID=S7UKC6_9BACT|nr:lysophospholipid acyltransferase family protein [Alkalidesulfovibrio alkalitolerans]EPR34269.1 phospholipid/glycerol acyltransferase [Alkalidesulfovibrio alkalitolerans DSM 16529]